VRFASDAPRATGGSLCSFRYYLYVPNRTGMYNCSVQRLSEGEVHGYAFAGCGDVSGDQVGEWGEAGRI
jgi:hypothetical protein